MNFAERLVGLYLRLNGFFLMPEFTTFSSGLKNEGHAHVDILAFRPGGAFEAFKGVNFPVDKALFDELENFYESPFEQDIAIVCEVRGNNRGEFPRAERQEYATRLCGETQIVLMCSDTSVRDIRYDAEGIRVGLEHALHWIGARITWLDKHGVSKSASWNASEPMLADMLMLNALRPISPNVDDIEFAFPQ